MKTGTIYNTVTGQIEMTIIAPDEEGVTVQTHGREDLGVIFDQQISGKNFYIADGKPVERPEMSLSINQDVYLGIDEVLRVDGIPVGAKVVHPDGISQVDDGFIEWSSVEPGQYHFHITCFPFKEVDFNAIVG